MGRMKRLFPPVDSPSRKPATGLPENIVHNHPGVPLHVYAGQYPTYYGLDRCSAHWHNDFEVIAVRRGRMRWHVNGRTFVAVPGEVVFVNSERIHACGLDDGARCDYDCALFPPAFVGASPGLRERFVDPVLLRAGFDSAVLRGEAAKAVARTLRDAVRTEEGRSPLAALRSAGAVFELWAGLLPALRETEEYRTAGTTAAGGRAARSDADIARAMVVYIRTNFAERLTLADIASAGGVCRSRCCAIFRRHFNQTPVDYLNAYRMTVAERLLRREPARTVADIAAACGFAHQSYFAQQFRVRHGTTPRRWRRPAEGNIIPSPKPRKCGMIIGRP